MCAIELPDGFYGYIIRAPQDLNILWLVPIVPVVVLIWIEVVRFLQPAMRLFSLPAFRLPEASTEVQSFRWYLGQLALLLVASSVLVFVEMPTEPAWGKWLRDTQESAQSACTPTVQQIITIHDGLNVTNIVLGILAPIVVFFIREIGAASSTTA